jgi:hypothetical protein
MSAPSALITVQNGNFAGAALATGASTYTDPGAALTISLTTTTGVVTWTITLQSDYAPLNGWTQTQGQNGPFTMPVISLPTTPCKITITSEVTDGNNNTSVTNYLYNYPTVQAPDRSVRGVAPVNINLTSANILLVATGLANDGLSNWVAGQRVLCVNQTTTSQNGPYVVQNVNANLATLVRPPDYQTGQVVPADQVYEVSEGTLYAGTTWKCLQSGNVTVDTTNTPNFFPKTMIFNVANFAANGAYTNTLFMSTGAQGFAQDTNSTAATKVVIANTANYGASKFTATCANANDAGAVLIINW